MPDVLDNIFTGATFTFSSDGSAGVFDGVFESELGGDKDWIRLEVTSTTTYQVYLSQQASGASSNGNPKISIYDAAGTLIDTQLSGGVGADAFMQRTLTPGTYFIGAETEAGQTDGSYTLFASTTTLTNQLGTTGQDFITTSLGGRYLLGFGNDVIDLSGVGSIVDALGDQGDDTLTGNFAVNNLSGGTGGDSLIGNGGNDVLFGDAGDDNLFGGNDNDQMFGGDGRDVMGGGLGADVMRGGDGDDVMFGNDGADDLNGDFGNDYVEGGAGNDRLGGSDGDVLVGGADDDLYDVVAGATIIENAGGGIDTVWSFTSFTLANDDEIEFLAAQDFLGTAPLNFTGNDFGQDIEGTNGNNILNGGFAEDDLSVDTLRGLLGNDTYVLGNGADTVTDTGGIDTITSTITRSLLSFTGIENLTLVGTAAANATGTAGANTLIGNSGVNILTGGLGRDVHTGGAGNDRFVFKTAGDSLVGASRDVITDFSTAGTLERIDLSAFAGTFTFRGQGAFSSAGNEVKFGKLGANTLVSIDLDGDTGAEMQILLLGQKTLTATDFVL